MHIQAYSIMMVIRTLAFFFHFNLTYFSTKFKKMYFVTATMSILMLN